MRLDQLKSNLTLLGWKRSTTYHSVFEYKTPTTAYMHYSVNADKQIKVTVYYKSRIQNYEDCNKALIRMIGIMENEDGNKEFEGILVK